MKKFLLFFAIFSLVPGLSFTQEKQRIYKPSREIVKSAIIPQQINLRIDITKLREVLKAQGDCPAGQWKFYLASWDTKGFCGIVGQEATNYCLPYFIYVPSPNGSVSEGSECGMVWMAEKYPGSASVSGKDVTDGYACVMNKNNPVFTNPPPSNACPAGTNVGTYETDNQLQYSCVSECNAPITPKCPSGYEVVSESSWQSIPSSCTKYGFTCSLGGFKYSWQNNDYFASCGKSGAQAVGGGYSVYCCAYTQ